ncbi:AsmA family protein [Roseibium algae]|uniref:AsmA family protein n=1 Tax=Roseibium algae TaxID=3123038 RepID=A0ABU8TS46_9HYPH
MRRLLIGLGALFFLLVTLVLAVPFFLPKEAIKRQVIAQVEKTVGWRLRLDGAVSLSLIPGFSLIAEQVGLSGEAGADGIEFAKAKKIEFGLGLAGLFGGEIRVTGIELVEPEIFLEIGPSGQTSWAPRRDLTPAEQAAEILSGELTAPTEPQPAAQNDQEEPSDVAYLKRIGIDRLEIVKGRVVYHDKGSEQRHEISELNLTLKAPDLTGEVGLESNFIWQEKPVAVSGSLTNPLGFVAGEQVPMDVLVGINESSLGVTGQAGLEPLRLNVAVSGSGPSLNDVAGLFGSPLASDPGAFSVFANVAGDETSVSMSDLSASVGSLGLDGQVDANLRGAVPEVSGRLVLRESSLEDLLKLAGQSFPASGSLGGDVSFSASGDTAETLLATLDIKGKAKVSDGAVSGLGLADAVGGDASADQINDIALELTFNGLDEKASLNGGLSWRGEAFSVTGNATPAPLLDGRSAPVVAKVKGKRFSAGFDGSVSGASGLMGAVSVETADLRSLLAWVGQPIEAGSGLQAFKASGLFSLAGNTLGFEETRFMLDETSGEANGRIVLSERPKIEAKLALNALVLDPYLQTGQSTTAAPSKGPKSDAGQAPSGGAGWSEAKIDFSGLKAADVDFAITTKEIVWDKIKIDQSALTATIKDGVLTAKLNTLRLYDGQGSGEIRLNGQGATPKVSANFSLDRLSAYPVLKAAADFDWLEGATNIALDVTTSGASQRALVDALSGTASFNFADGAIRGLNIPKLVRGLSIETLLGWQSTPEEKTDFSTLSASFDIKKGVATSGDLTLIGPLVRMSGQGTTDMPNRTLDWRVEPKIVASLQGQAPTPRKKGAEKKMAGLGVPVVIRGAWDDPQIYPDIKGILENPEAAYQQLQSMGGELSKILKGGKPDDALVETANEAIKKATGGRAQIDIQKVIEGDVDDQEILKAVEEGLGLPSGLLGNFGRKKKE